jgi:hypothetical protein
MSHVTERPRNAERRTLTPAHTGHVSAGTDRRLIVGVDDSASGTAALRWAIARARGEPALLVAVRFEHAASWPALHHAAVSDYLTGHARCPVVVVPTMNEASS